MTSGNDSAPQPSSPSGTTRTVAAPSPEAVLEALVDRTPHALAYLDREFNFVHVNAAYAESSHRPPVELIGRNHFELYPHAENEAIFRRVRDTGETAIWREKPFVFPDQPERGITYWDWTLSAGARRDGDVTGLVFSLVRRDGGRARTPEDRRERGALPPPGGGLGAGRVGS